MAHAVKDAENGTQHFRMNRGLEYAGAELREKLARQLDRIRAQDDSEGLVDLLDGKASCEALLEKPGEMPQLMAEDSDDTVSDADSEPLEYAMLSVAPRLSAAEASEILDKVRRQDARHMRLKRELRERTAGRGCEERAGLSQASTQDWQSEDGGQPVGELRRALSGEEVDPGPAAGAEASGASPKELSRSTSDDSAFSATKAPTLPVQGPGLDAPPGVGQEDQAPARPQPQQPATPSPEAAHGYAAAGADASSAGAVAATSPTAREAQRSPRPLKAERRRAWCSWLPMVPLCVGIAAAALSDPARARERVEALSHQLPMKYRIVPEGPRLCRDALCNATGLGLEAERSLDIGQIESRLQSARQFAKARSQWLSGVGRMVVCAIGVVAVLCLLLAVSCWRCIVGAAVAVLAGAVVFVLAVIAAEGAQLLTGSGAGGAL